MDQGGCVSNSTNSTNSVGSDGLSDKFAFCVTNDASDSIANNWTNVGSDDSPDRNTVRFAHWSSN